MIAVNDRRQRRYVEMHQSSLFPAMLFALLAWGISGVQAATQPNILIAISDDQSHAHIAFSGCRFVSTPAFDRIAKEGEPRPCS